MKKYCLVTLIGVIGVAISLLNGWWWITPIVGLLIGLCMYHTSTGFILSFCVGSLGWSLPLIILAAQAPIVGVANVVENVIGLPTTGGILLIALTVGLGCVLSISGTWVGVAYKGLRHSYRVERQLKTTKELTYQRDCI